MPDLSELPKDPISVLIERYNPHPETPLTRNRIHKGSREHFYDITFVRDGEEIWAQENHFSYFGRNERKIEIRIGLRHIQSEGRDVNVAMIKSKDNGKNLGDSELVAQIHETFCVDSSLKKLLRDQIRCLRIGINLIEELYTPPAEK